MMLDEEVVNKHPEVAKACLELQKVVSDKQTQDLNFKDAKMAKVLMSSQENS